MNLFSDSQPTTLPMRFYQLSVVLLLQEKVLTGLLKCGEQEPAALRLGVERKGGFHLQHGFFSAYPLLRCLVVAGAPFGDLCYKFNIL